MMNWFGYAIVSLLAFSIYEVMARLLGVGSKNPRAFSVIYNLLICLYFVPFFYIEPWPGIEFSGKILFWMVVSIIIWTVFVRYEYYAHQQVEATTLAIVLKLAPVITFGVSILVLGENLTSAKILGIGLILLANYVLIPGERRGGRLSWKGIQYAIVVMLSLGLAWVMDKVVAPWYGVVVYSIMASGPPAVVNAMAPRLRISDLKAEWHQAGWKILVLPVFTVIGYFGMIKALTIGEASRVVPVATATTPLVMLMAVIFLKERHNLWVKLGAVLLTVAGIWAMK